MVIEFKPRSRLAERLEEARLRAEYFAKGGVVKRFPMWTRGPEHHRLNSSWGRQLLRREQREKKDADDK